LSQSAYRVHQMLLYDGGTATEGEFSLSFAPSRPFYLRAALKIVGMHTSRLVEVEVNIKPVLPRQADQTKEALHPLIVSRSKVGKNLRAHQVPQNTGQPECTKAHSREPGKKSFRIVVIEMGIAKNIAIARKVGKYDSW